MQAKETADGGDTFDGEDWRAKCTQGLGAIEDTESPEEERVAPKVVAEGLGGVDTNLVEGKGADDGKVTDAQPSGDGKDVDATSTPKITSVSLWPTVLLSTFCFPADANTSFLPLNARL